MHYAQLAVNEARHVMHCWLTLKDAMHCALCIAADNGVRHISCIAG